MLRIAAGTLTATIGTGVVAVRETVGSENFDRSMSFYAVAIPGYCNYRYMDLRTRNIPQAERDKKFEKLHKVWAPAALEKILELRGFYIKVGQMAATNIGNAFPDKWVRTMEVLQDNVPPRDINTVRKIIETEYGCSVDELFESIEHKPVGAASIGQVHRAVLRQGTTLEAMLRKKSNGSTVDSDLQDASARKAEERPPRNVVVKVQYPEVESFFRGDVQTIKWFCKVAQPEHVKALEEIEKQFMTEFDYREEGKNLDSVRRNLAKPFPGVVIPRPWLSLCTKYLLVMEDLSPATKLADALRADAGKVAMLQARLSGGDGGDGAGGGVRGQATRGDDVPLPKVGADADEAERGMSAEAMDAILARAAAAIRVSNAAARAHNRAVGWLRWVPVLGSRLAKRWPLKPEIQPRDALPLNHARVVDDLLIVHGHQILIDGCFNGDPHPGNVLIVHNAEEGSGYNRSTPSPPPSASSGSNLALSSGYMGGDHLGLIDFGQVKHLNLEQRLRFARMIVALNVDDRKRVVQALLDMGHRTKYCSEENLYTMAKLIYDSNDKERLKGYTNIQALLDDLQAQDPVVKVGEDYVLVGRVCIMLRGLGHILKQPRSTSDVWLPLAKRLLVENGQWNDADDELIRLQRQRRKLERRQTRAQQKKEEA